MNFAEELKIWRAHQPEIKKSEDTIKELIHARCRYVMDHLKADPNSMVIPMTVFDMESFMEAIATKVSLEYNKKICDIDELREIILTTFESYPHVYTADHGLINSGRLDQFLIVNLENFKDKTPYTWFGLFVLQWFENIILTTFKEEYIKKNTDEVTFEPYFVKVFDFTPVRTILEAIYSSQNIDYEDEIEECIIEKSLDAGLGVDIYRDGTNRFRLILN